MLYQEMHYFFIISLLILLRLGISRFDLATTVVYRLGMIVRVPANPHIRDLKQERTTTGSENVGKKNEFAFFQT